MQKLKIVIVRCHDEKDEIKVIIIIIKLGYPNTIKSHWFMQTALTVWDGVEE